MKLRLAILLFVIALLSSLAQAQIRAGAGAMSPARIVSAPPRANHEMLGQHFRHRQENSAIFLGAPYYYADYEQAPAAIASPPQIIVVQVPQPAATESPKELKVEPLLIELQGDRYVRLSSASDTDAKRPTPETKIVKLERISSESAVIFLIFRDGHREEIREYTIADGALYVRNDHWSEGSWTRKVQLKALDIAATQQANQGRGVQLVLPSGPNQVVASF